MKYFFVPFLFFMSCFVIGQTREIDSLIIELKKVKGLEKKALIENKLASAYIKERKLQNANETANNALLKGIEIDNPTVIADAYLNIANIHYINWEGPEAIKYYQKVDSVLSKNNILNSTLYKSKSNIGNLIYRTDYDSLDLIKIKGYFNESLDIALALKDTLQQSKMLIRLGDLHQNKVEYDSAIAMYKKAEKLIKKDDKESLADLYWALAGVYFDLNDTLKAKNYTNKRYDLVKNSANINERASANWVHGNLLFMAEDYKNAIKHHKISISLYESLEYRNYGRLAGAGGRIYRAYEKLNDYKSAFNYLKKTMIYNDSALAKSRNNKVEELETKYQTEKKEQEITLLKSQKKLAEQQKKNQRNLFLGGLGVTTIAGLFLFILYRNRQKTNTKLKELDKIKSNFFANISHEFRTPLTLIADPINEALDNDALSDKKRQQFTVAQQNSERLLSLVNQVLDLSKIDAGQLKLHIQNDNALKLISALSASFSYSAKQKGISYLVNIEEKEENVWFDKDAIEKITINLLSNALKYTPENGSVTCNAYTDNNRLFFEIKNTGKGLSSEDLNNIFERFYQSNEQNQGTGIGLALVKELVELHKGTISVNSVPNAWTTFTVTLPVDKNSFKNEEFVGTTSTGAIRKTPIPSHSTNENAEEFTDSELPILLIVEDNADLRTLLKQTFDTRYNVMTASNGKIGVELALEHIPDLIISDIMMSEKDGITLTKELKTDERTSHIPIILLTAKAEVESQFEGINTGADDYITKPFDKKLLKLKVEKLIESRKKLQLRYSQEVILMPKDIAITNLDEVFLEKVQVVLDQNLVESSFNTEDFSKAVGLSRMQLHRKIKALTGLSASEFIRSQRLKLAAQLLKKSDINISQVGYTVGFNDHSYFTKCFKEAYNCTPTEYSKQHS